MGSLKPVYPHFSFEQDYRAKLRFPFQSPVPSRELSVDLFQGQRRMEDGMGVDGLISTTGLGLF